MKFAIGRDHGLGIEALVWYNSCTLFTAWSRAKQWQTLVPFQKLYHYFFLLFVLWLPLSSPGFAHQRREIIFLVCTLIPGSPWSCSRDLRYSLLGSGQTSPSSQHFAFWTKNRRSLIGVYHSLLSLTCVRMKSLSQAQWQRLWHATRECMSEILPFSRTFFKHPLIGWCLCVLVSGRVLSKGDL